MVRLPHDGDALRSLITAKTEDAEVGAFLLRIQNAKAPGAAAAARATVTYGSARFTIPAKKTRTITVKLAAAGRRLLRTRRTATVWANSTVGSGSSKRVVSAKLTLKR